MPRLRMVGNRYNVVRASREAGWVVYRCKDDRPCRASFWKTAWVVCGHGFDETSIYGTFGVEKIACEAIAKVRGSVLDDGQREVIHIGESLGWIEMKATQDCGFEIFGYFRPEDMEWGVVAMDDSVKKLFVFEVLEGRAPGQQKVEQGGDTVLIALLGRLLAAEELGCDVAVCSWNHSNVSYSCLVRLENGRIEGERQAEVENLHALLPRGRIGDKDVAGLEVAVNDGARVASGYTAADREGEVNRLLD